MSGWRHKFSISTFKVPSVHLLRSRFHCPSKLKKKIKTYLFLSIFLPSNSVFTFRSLSFTLFFHFIHHKWDIRSVMPVNQRINVIIKDIRITWIEGSNAKVVQLITCIKFRSFFTPDMASKNDARHDIRLFSAGITRCHIWQGFLPPCLGQKATEMICCNQLRNFGKWAFN